ncbi:hypothetical protein Pcinc_012967 [Petrolisthes cinctipes]|uniref:G-protein coupled receptors family 2 profile 2 domain-containing protein n=1 Tax=Petrolisthes cinctipes TaxID=88211 RepID=A0AAE1FZL2_PETCI|nr:hypothetical protein Pcinc_012967 [Petrolisthes cinctipes]
MVMRVGVCLVVLVSVVMTSSIDHYCRLHHSMETCRGIHLQPHHHLQPHNHLQPHQQECKCDAACAHYGECCVDAGPYRQEEAEQYDCISVNIGQIYMKSCCPEGWQDERVARMCRDGSPLYMSNSTDPLNHLPVTSATTARTYTNHYCATCNNDSRNLTTWKLHMDCHLLQFERLDSDALEEVLKTLTLINGTWGVFSKSTFHQCHMTPRWPRGVWVRPCTPAVAQCAPDWTRIDTSRRCASYIAPVYSQGKKYKNIDCAICNMLHSEDVSCDEAGQHLYYPPYSIDHNSQKQQTTSEIPMQTFIRGEDSIYGLTTTPIPMSRPAATLPRPLPPPLPAPPRPPHISYLTTTTPTPTTTIPPTTTNPPGHINMVLDDYDYEYRDTFHGHSFSIIMDFREVCGGDLVGLTSDCQLLKLRDLNMCRDIMCHSGSLDQENYLDPARSCEYVFRRCQGPNSKYIVGNETAARVGQVENVRDGNHTNLIIMANTNSTIPTRLNSTKCLNVMLEEKEYEMSEMGVVSVGRYNWKKNEYREVKGGVVVCWPRPPAEKFSPVMGWMSRAGLGLSCLCLLLHLTAFIFTPYLRNLPGKCRASLSLSLLGAYISFLVGSATRPHTTQCFVLAVTMHYSFLASLCWMKVMAFDVWWSLRLARKELRVSGRGQNRRFIIYSVYSWLLAAFPSATVLALDFTNPEGLPPNMLPSMGQYWCWFGQRRALLLFFGAPLFVIIILNVVFFLATACEITITQEMGRVASQAHHKRHFQLYLRLAVLMGFTWISGIVAGYLQLEAAWYIFVLLNTLQGVFIFLAFTCRTKVWRGMVTAWRCGGKPSPRPHHTPARTLHNNNNNNNKPHASTTTTNTNTTTASTNNINTTTTPTNNINTTTTASTNNITNNINTTTTASTNNSNTTTTASTNNINTTTTASTNNSNTITTASTNKIPTPPSEYNCTRL